MQKRQPPLHLLKLFEAAARLESFKRAAQELHLTPSAVSHQIKALEEQLGFELFLRLNRRIELTTAGSAYFEIIADVFKRLKKGTDDVLNRFTQQRLKISIMPSLARHFLIPRIAELQHRLPEVELIVDASAHMVDFKTSDVDVAIRYGSGMWPGLTCEKVTDIHASPLCSPEFAARYQLRAIQDLLTAPLLRFAFMSDVWLKLGQSLGLDELSSGGGLTFSNYDMAIQAAEQGVGITMGLLEMEVFSLQSGRLIKPFEIEFPVRDALYLVYRNSDKDRPEIKILQHWILNAFSSTKTSSE